MRTKPDLVKRGDSDTIEFKSQIPQKQEAIAIAAVAFGKAVIVITVPEGKDKPYQVKGKGFYIASRLPAIIAETPLPRVFAAGDVRGGNVNSNQGSS